MGMSYKYDSEPNIVRTAVTGILTFGDILAYTKGVIGDAVIRSGFIEVVDLEFVEDLEIKYSDLQPLGEIAEAYKHKGWKATIIYAPTDVSYGVSRMVQLMLTSKHVPDEDYMIVRSRDELTAKLQELRA